MPQIYQKRYVAGIWRKVVPGTKSHTVSRGNFVERRSFDKKLPSLTELTAGRHSFDYFCSHHLLNVFAASPQAFKKRL